jgi:hypothetical protein
MNYKASTLEEHAQQDKETLMGWLEKLNVKVFTFR